MGTNRRSQRGEGKIGMVISLVLLVAAGYAAFNALPVYWADWQLQDKMKAAALGPPNDRADKSSRKRLNEAIVEIGLAEYVGPEAGNDCQIRRIGSDRQITCYYEREVQWLPGFKRLTVFDHHISQPAL
jgi:hypothetical protein